MLALFAVALAVQVGCWVLLGLGFARVRDARPDAEHDGDEGNAPAPLPSPALPISVVVAARNEEARLPRLLDALEWQTHPVFEIVIADDGSTDGTAALVEERAARWAARGGPILTLVRVPEGEAAAAGMPRKKHALAHGIAAARHDRLAFTDADTTPPPTWLAALARHAAPDGEDDGAVLVGYGPYRAEPGVLNAFVRYETTVTALLTVAAVGWGRPFMAVGRNFSYPKALFERIGGFDSGRRSLSGDDDLLVQEVVRQRAAPVRYVLDPAAFVPSEAPRTWSAWARQKRRHASAGRFYPPLVNAGLAVFHGSALLLWLGVPVLLAAHGTWHGAGLLAARFLVQRGVLRSAARALGAWDGITLWQPLLDLPYTLYATLFAPLAGLRAPHRW